MSDSKVDSALCKLRVQYNARNSAVVKLVTKASQWRKIGTRGRRSKGRGALNLRITSFAGNAERQSFVPCPVFTYASSDYAPSSVPRVHARIITFTTCVIRFARRRADPETRTRSRPVYELAYDVLRGYEGSEHYR
ncbi:hypothetical protein EVAR_93902_1 [Eumeta japonica]|uniref:Uncharacterized protein n=1 Tax=Eumeta variegata TaxID=151549 RepID=A0A4C1TP14_EUMVA|nr:hypothetical protein EVAR_93902_1 [Eumeta japonica]